MGEKVSNFSPKVPRRAVRTAFYVTRGWILWKKKFWKYTVLWFSPTPSKCFQTSCAEFSAGLPIMHFTRPKWVFGKFFRLKSALHIHGFQAVIGAVLLHKTFRLGCPIWIQKCPDDPISEKKTCWNIYQFLYFWTVSSNFSDFWHKKNDWVAETALYGFRDF